MIYFDNAATTKVSPSVAEKVAYMLGTCFGNPSSLHSLGFEAEREVNEAKNTLAKCLNVQADELYFTSGGTESNNLALLGLCHAYKREGNHIITTNAEHASILSALSHLSENGFDVTYIEANDEKTSDLDQILAAIRPETILVTVGHVNSETGRIQNIHALAKAVKEKKPSVIIHTDCVQSFGKLPIQANYIDAISISGHKLHAPKGVGALYVKKNVKIKPLLYGGGQQKSLRPGTENASSVAAFGLAAKIAHEQLATNATHVQQVKNRMLDIVHLLDGVHVNGDPNPTNNSPYILNLTFESLRGEVLLHALESRDIYISTGSACSEKYKKRQQTIRSKKEEGAVRFSFSHENTVAQAEQCLAALQAIVPELRRFVRK